MDVQLLGTGSQAGWPDPWCGCASCTAGRATATLRSPSALLVGGTLLIGSVPPGSRYDLSRVRPGGDVVDLGDGCLDVTHVGRDGPSQEGTRPTSARLLWCPTPTVPPLPGAARYDAVFLGCPSGEDFAAWAETVALMRRDGAASVFVPIELGHGNPWGAELSRRFGHVGATLLSDGDTLTPGADAHDADTSDTPAFASAGGRLPRPWRVLITGGARSGKSVEAERRLLGEPRVTYVATSLPRPGDASWEARVQLHRGRRPAHWETVETLDVAGLLADPEATLLIDCATLWLGAHLEDPGRSAKIDELVAAWRWAKARVVLVTNEVGSGVHPATAMGREFADELGRLNARLAEYADEIVLVVMGQAVTLR